MDNLVLFVLTSNTSAMSLPLNTEILSIKLNVCDCPVLLPLKKKVSEEQANYRADNTTEALLFPVRR